MRTKQAEPTVTTIRAGDVLAGMEYPYLPEEWEWEIRTIPFDLLEQAATGPEPTLRLVKDDKVIDLHVLGMETATFLRQTGLCPSMTKGGYVLSKRLSRLLHPYRYWRFFDEDELRIVHRNDWDARLWDGCGRVSRRFLRQKLLPMLADLPEAQRREYERELLHTGRFEITLMHAGGQEKGDVIVFDRLPGGADFIFPAGSAKTELRQEGRIFVGLAAARHARDGMRADPQSLINLHPFFAPEQVLAWTEMESGLFLEALEAGTAGRVYSRLAGDEERLAKLSNWHVAEYLASGGDPRWFAGITRELGRQHLHRLVNQSEDKLRFPMPGGRYYICPATVGEREVPRGHVELDPPTATAWVNDEDWVEWLVEILGGCDGDDALWVLPFTDHDGEQKILAWRSPNQLGEYVLLRPTERCHTIRWALAGGGHLAWPALDSRLLPPRVDTVPYEYATLAVVESGSAVDEGYSVAAMEPTIRLAQANQGVLGAFCNLGMVTKALYGRLPLRLPATLETIIDGSVKRFIDLSPVRAWVEGAAVAIVAQGKPVPACLVGRLDPLLPKEWRRGVRVSGGEHWLDLLMDGLRVHQEAYAAAVEAVASRAMPPAEFFGCFGPEWKPLGRALRQMYADVLRRGGTQEAARRACETHLTGHPEADLRTILLAAAACCYSLGKEEEGTSDNVLWQLGPRRADGSREPGIAQTFLAALREIGLVGEPVWTTEGAVLYYRTDGPRGNGAVPVTLMGTWYNWLRVVQPDAPPTMGMVPKPLREQVKATIATLADRHFPGMTLLPEEDEGRLVMRTTRGNLFGYVAKGHEGRVQAAARWTIAWAVATDGNVHAVLRPAA